MNEEIAMMNKIVLLVIVGVVGVLLMPSQVDAYGAAHVGYTQVGPNGVSHTGATAVSGPNGTAAVGHTSAYGAGGAYGGGAAAGGYHYNYHYSGGGSSNGVYNCPSIR